MGIKFPPIYGENVDAYVNEGKKALDFALVEYNKGNNEKALSSLDYASKCVEGLRDVLSSHKEQK